MTSPHAWIADGDDAYTCDNPVRGRDGASYDPHAGETAPAGPCPGPVYGEINIRPGHEMCNRCRVKAATHRVREMCPECDDVGVCQSCFDFHVLEIEGDRENPVNPRGSYGRNES